MTAAGPLTSAQMLTERMLDAGFDEIRRAAAERGLDATDFAQALLLRGFDMLLAGRTTDEFRLVARDAIEAYTAGVAAAEAAQAQGDAP